MKLTVDTKSILRELPRVECYQNSTLRYTPPADFPEYFASKVGRAKIMRTWVTLDEVYDWRTDEYELDYLIGFDRYAGDERHHRYDLGVIRPTGVKFIEYLTSYCSVADEVMLNIRRYEREVLNGYITMEKYEQIVERVVGDCKALCPNIRYIEACNEVHYKSFGAMTIDEYYPFYQAVCRAVSRLNAKHNYELPLTVGGCTTDGTIGRFYDWVKFMRLLAADKSPELMIGFYSVHDYNPNIFRLLDFKNRLDELRDSLGLPEVPIFVDEYGRTHCSDEPTSSLENASGVIAGMILSSHLKNLYVFPWCSYHNPELQRSYTEFVKTEDGYAPTPNGNSIIALHKLGKYECEIREKCDYQAIATVDEDGKCTILVTNPSDAALSHELSLLGLEAERVTVKRFVCDSKLNNRITGELCTDFEPTEIADTAVVDGVLALTLTLEAHAFVLIEIK